MTSDEFFSLTEKHRAILDSLRYESGLYAASSKEVTTGYDKAWLRDNFYVSLALGAINEKEKLEKLYDAILEIFLKHERKIDYAIATKPNFSYEYIHPRYHPQTFDEFWESWGNKQHDAIGALLFAIGVFTQRGYTILANDAQRRIIQKLIQYLASIEYWHDADSGIWEEAEEIHSSSLGACLAGLKKIKEIGFDVSDEILKKGEDMLYYELLPRESHEKFSDLALLTLIYPYNILGPTQAHQVLDTIEYHLVKSKGVIRYKGDHYYNKNWDKRSEEAEWTFGFSFLALSYLTLGDKERAHFYLQKAIQTINEKGEVPELYLSGTAQYNENSPLAWSEAMLILAIQNVSSL